MRLSRSDKEFQGKSPERSSIHHGGGWIRGRILGHGSFGTVHMAYIPHPRTELFKRFPELVAVKSANAGTKAAQQLRNEVKMGGLLKGSPFVIRILGSDTTYSPDGRRLVANLFMELANRGTLADLVAQNWKPGLEEWKVRSFIKSVVRGLARIHEMGYVHRDLKLDNVLVVKEANGCFTAKVADLGLAERENPRGLPGKVAGTHMYWSPEVVVERVQGRPADIWALGCTVFAVLTGELLWNYVYGRKLSSSELMQAISKGPPKLLLPAGKYSPWALDFMEKCLRKDPRQRPTAEELLRHPFLVGVDHQVYV